MFSSRRSRARRRPVSAALLISVAAAPLGACSGDAVRTLATEAGYGPRPVAAPDFVVGSRPTEPPGFMAVGVDAPRPATRAKNAEGQRALAAELEGARGRNEVRGRAAESAGRGAGKATGKAAGEGAGTAAGAPPPQE